LRTARSAEAPGGPLRCARSATRVVICQDSARTEARTGG
jgi:hypothetical protein